MKIAITGGAGFIGTQLATLLKDQGHEIVLIDLLKSNAFPDDSVIADVCDAEAMTAHLSGCDAVYHLAAEHRDDVSPIQKYFDVNVGGGENVLNAAREHNVSRVIFTSSVAVYPLEPEDPIGGSAEIHKAAPFNDYGQSKLDSEATFETWADENKARALTMVRLVATFGIGNRGNIFNLINQIASGKFMMIGSGRNQKSIAYVGNVAAFLAHALENPAGINLYNYADKPDLEMKDFVTSVREALDKEGVGLQIPYGIGIVGGYVFDLLAKLTGRTFPISSIRVKKFCANTIVNADKAQASGFKAPYSLKDGLNEMISAEFPRGS